MTSIYTRLGMYFFIIGALISIFDGAFIQDPSVHGIIYIILIFTGIFAGLLNISEDEEHHFLMSAGVFILVIMAFNQIFAAEPFLALFTHFFKNAIAFVGSMAIVVALKSILEFGSQNYKVSHVENLELKTEEVDDWMLRGKMKTWHFIVFIAVAITFLIILLQLPIYTLPPAMEQALLILEWIVIAIFIIDLVILYKHEKNFVSFLKNCWIDIIAAVPIPGIFGAVKIVRVARIARIARISHSLKFFSKKSGMNTYLRKANHRTHDLEVKEHPTAKQKTSHKKKR
jgi:hypothetical protein